MPHPVLKLWAPFLLRLSPSLRVSFSLPQRAQAISNRYLPLRAHFRRTYFIPCAFPHRWAARSASSRVLYSCSGGGAWSRSLLIVGSRRSLRSTSRSAIARWVLSCGRTYGTRPYTHTTQSFRDSGTHSA